MSTPRDAGRVMRHVMCAFTAAFLVAALLAPDRGEMLDGLGRMLFAPSQLTRDYFLPELGGLSASMLNTALMGAICSALMFLPGAVVNGGTVLAYFLTVGFGTYGMNVLNLLPPVLGTFVYAKLKGKPLGALTNAAMFSTAIAPLVSEALFRYPGVEGVHGITPAGIALAVGIGLASGLLMPALCAHSPAFHRSFNLYNAGPAAGFLCFLLYALMYRVRGVEAPAITAVLGEGERMFVNLFCGVSFGLCVLAGLLLGAGDYGALLRDRGYRTDFTARYGAGSNVLNLGVYGLIILLYYNLIGARFTGATMGAVFCMVCCCCGGATPLNVLPIMAGYLFMGLLNRLGVTAYPVNAQAIVVGLCFASGLAPISGVYGPVAGVVAAMLHYCLVTSVPFIHGGFNLYNGGFTAGIVCFLLAPVLERLLPDKMADA